MRPSFVKNVTAAIIRQEGDSIPVSQMPIDGIWPSGTTQYEKRNIAVNDSGVEPATPASSAIAVRSSARTRRSGPRHTTPSCLTDAPPTFKSTDAKGKELAGLKYTMQVAPEDCTGCGVCVQNCPAQAQRRRDHPCIPRRRSARPRRKTGTFFLWLPDTDPKFYQADHGQGKPVHPAALRIQRRLRRLRRDALCQAALPALRRPRAHRERHRLLLDLRRQPADNALYHARRRTRPGMDTTRSSKTMPRSPSACGLTVDKFNEYAQELVAKDGRRRRLRRRAEDRSRRDRERRPVDTETAWRFSAGGWRSREGRACQMS